jgi:hypothetical protein
MLCGIGLRPAGNKNKYLRFWHPAKIYFAGISLCIVFVINGTRIKPLKTQAKRYKKLNPPNSQNPIRMILVILC